MLSLVTVSILQFTGEKNQHIRVFGFTSTCAVEKKILRISFQPIVLNSDFRV